ncbi:MAG: FMN-binding protein [Faecousia sp.]
MIFIISLVIAAAFILLCGKALRAHPAPFYIAAAALSALVIELYWAAPGFLSLQMRTRLPILIGAVGTAFFIFVMYAGALPNGHPLMKKIMPIRGELSIFACLLTLGHNLSYGKNYLTPGYLFSAPVSPTKVAAWISAVSILLMLMLTITSIKAVRKCIQPKKWKALQRWAYLFYALVYLHVLLLAIPNLLKGRTTYTVNLLVYSLVYLSYAVCRIQKAVLVKRGQAAKVTGRRQLAGAGVGVLLSLVLLAGVSLPAASVNSSQTADGQAPADTDQQSTSVETLGNSTEQLAGEPDPELPGEPSPDAAVPEEPSPDPAAESSEVPSPDPAPELSSEPSPASTAESTPASVTTPAAPTEASPAPTPTPVPNSTPEPTPTPTPVPTSKYKDGTFTGTGMGYEGPVTVSVTISGDRITNITVTSYVDDDEYMGDAKTGVITSILLLQSTNVSAVSGATYSSEGIMDAVAAALQEAAN